MNLLEPTPQGLYCPAADAYIDPSRRVARAIITHGHSDHARPGHRWALTSRSGEEIVRQRIGGKTEICALEFGEPIQMGRARISLHPAGHLLGSARVRIEVDGKVAVACGDYKRGVDPTCETFEPLRCDLLVTETTFGLPVYRWPDPAGVAKDIDAWWARNRAAGVGSVLLGYSLGKAQRLLAMLRPEGGPIFVHGALLSFLSIYRRAGIRLPQTLNFTPARFRGAQGQGVLVISPASFHPKLREKLGPVRVALASGWTLCGKHRSSGGVTDGFAISDHVDWPELMQTVDESGAEEVWTQHGYTREVAQYLRETRGLRTREI